MLGSHWLLHEDGDRWSNRQSGKWNYLLLLDKAYCACFCWRSSVMASSFFSTCCRHTQMEIIVYNWHRTQWVERLRQLFFFLATHLLYSSFVAQGAEFIWVSSTDLMQGSKVSGQIDPKVLWSIRQVRDILQKPERKQYHFKLKFQRGRLVGFVKMTCSITFPLLLKQLT